VATLIDVTRRFALKLTEHDVFVVRGGNPGLALSRDHQRVISHWRAWHVGVFSIMVDANMVTSCIVQEETVPMSEESIFTFLGELNRSKA
jgi:hypothetical protein